MTNVVNLHGPKQRLCNIFRTKNVLLYHHNGKNNQNRTSDEGIEIFV
jgi:hypothetical protein